MHRFTVRFVSLLSIAFFLFAANAAADIVITSSTTAPLLTSIEVPVALVNNANAPTVIGSLPGGVKISFATPRGLDSLYVHTDGHPRIEAEDGSINVLTITGNTVFSDMMADIFGVYDQNRNHVTVVVNASDGIHTQVLPMNIGQATSNYIWIMATDGVTISSINLGTDSDPARFHALRDIYISGAEMPEPSNMILFGSGLAGMAGLVRRRRTARPV